MEANPFNLPAIDEPALAGSVKSKWRERLRSRGKRLVLTPASDRPRRKQPCENIDWLAVNEKSDLQDEAEAVRRMPCAQNQPA